jgi:thiopeptide-type bacteriocin biosynthesis protein
VERLLAGVYEEEPLRLGAVILEERSRKFAPLVQDLQMGVRQKRIPNPIEDLVASYIHMYTNRLLRSAARAQELVLYDYLARAYRSQRGRAADQ